jgi:hypothetical protein
MNYLSWDESTHCVLDYVVSADVDRDTRAETRPQDTAMENTE